MTHSPSDVGHTEFVDDGGSAFPTLETEKFHPQFGMSLRDYFASQVLGTLIGYHGFTPEYDNYLRAARDSYKAADAMLSARAALLAGEGK